MGLVEKGPEARLHSTPSFFEAIAAASRRGVDVVVQQQVAVGSFNAKLFEDLFFSRLVCVKVKSVDGLQGFLGVPVGRVGHPAAGFDLGLKVGLLRWQEVMRSCLKVIQNFISLNVFSSFFSKISNLIFNREFSRFERIFVKYFSEFQEEILLEEPILRFHPHQTTWQPWSDHPCERELME